MGIDNVTIDVSAAEIPIWMAVRHPLFLIQSAGIEDRMREKFVRIKRPVTVKQDGKEATFKPFDGLDKFCH